MPETCLFCQWCRVAGSPHGLTTYVCDRMGREIRSSDVMRTRCGAFERSAQT